MSRSADSGRELAQPAAGSAAPARSGYRLKPVTSVAENGPYATTVDSEPEEIEREGHSLGSLSTCRRRPRIATKVQVHGEQSTARRRAPTTERSDRFRSQIMAAKAGLEVYQCQT